MIVNDGRSYFYELKENRKGVQFFEMKEVQHYPIRSGHVPRRNIWLGMNEMMEVWLFDYSTTVVCCRTPGKRRGGGTKGQNLTDCVTTSRYVLQSVGNGHYKHKH